MDVCMCATCAVAQLFAQWRRSQHIIYHLWAFHQPLSQKITHILNILPFMASYMSVAVYPDEELRTSSEFMYNKESFLNQRLDFRSNWPLFSYLGSFSVWRYKSPAQSFICWILHAIFVWNVSYAFHLFLFKWLA